MFTRKDLVLVVLFVLSIFATPVVSFSAEGVWTTYPPVRNADSVELFVNSIAVDKNNVKWFGAYGGVYSLDGNGGVVLYKKNGLVSDNVKVVAVDLNNIKWFGTEDGISTYDDNDRNTPAVWRTYTTADGLVDNFITSIAFDKDNVAWVGTINGVSSFDGTTWKIYAAEGGLAGNGVRGIAVDAENVKWFATNENGIFSFDGAIWKNYTDKDGLVYGRIINMVTSVAVDADNVKWFGTSGCMSSFDGATFKNYYVPYYFVQAIAVDARNTKWFGTTKRIVSFDGAIWKTYVAEGGLVGNGVRGIAVDAYNDKWFLTDFGVVCRYYDGTSTSVEESAKAPQSINLRVNFPNPFNPSTTIEFSIGYENQVAIDIYSIAGQKIKTLIDGRLTAGVHSVVWDGKDETGKVVSSGTYFCRMIAGNLVRINKMTLLR